MAERVIQEVAIDRLVCRPQVRESSGFADEEIAGLAQSIAESGGIHQPLLVRRDGDRLVVLDGQRRLRAARMAGLATVPVIIEERELSEGDVLHRQLVIDAQRVGLSAIERARAIRRLTAQTGWSDAQAAVKLGLSPAQVSKLLALLVLPEEVQRQVAAGRLAMSTAYELAKVPDSAERERLAADAVNGGLTRDGVVKRRKAAADNRTPAKPRRPAQRRERLVIPMNNGQSITVSGSNLSVESIVALLAELLDRIGRVSGEGRRLEEVVKAVAGSGQ